MSILFLKSKRKNEKHKEDFESTKALTTSFFFFRSCLGKIIKFDK